MHVCYMFEFFGLLLGIGMKGMEKGNTEMGMKLNPITLVSYTLLGRYECFSHRNHLNSITKHQYMGIRVQLPLTVSTKIRTNLKCYSEVCPRLTKVFIPLILFHRFQKYALFLEHVYSIEADCL